MLLRVVTAPMLSLLIVLQVSPVVAEVLDIALREQASLVRPYYSLGDIAAIHSSDAELATKLSALRIGRSPRIGSAEIVTRSALSARIQGALPAPVTAHWRGSARTELRTIGREIPVGDYEGAARTALEAWLRAISPRFEIRGVPSTQTVKLPEGDLEVAARIAAGELPRKRMRVWLDFTLDGEHYATAPVWFEIDLFREVFVATADLPAGAVLSADGVKQEWADVSKTSGSPVVDLAGRLPQLAKRPIEAGSIVVAEDLKALPAVSHGDEVVVVSRVGPVVVEVSALALQDGAEGEKIRVSRPDGEAHYEVVVTGRKRALAGVGRP